jgi:hypothetical protein
LLDRLFLHDTSDVQMTCVLLFDAVCKSEHAVHVTSESRMTGD